jgi:hypothetical protein
MQFHNGADIETDPNFVQILEDAWWRPWQWSDKRSGKKDWVVYRKSKLKETKKEETGKEQSKEHAHHFLWHQGDTSLTIHPGRPNSQFRILLWRFTATAWKCGKTSPKLWQQKNWLLHRDDMTIVPHPPYFSVSWLEIQMNRGDRGRITSSAEHPTEHNFRGITSRVMTASRPKVSFWPDGSTSPRNYRWLFV